METRQEGNVVVVKLSDGEDLVPSLEAAAQKHRIESGSVVWGSGMLHDFEFPFLFRLLPELLVMIFAEMDAPRFADQLELGEGFLHLLRREGPLRFLPATLHPADIVRGHGCGDAGGDICRCAVPDLGSPVPMKTSILAISLCGAACEPPRGRRSRARRPLPLPIPHRTQVAAPAAGC